MGVSVMVLRAIADAVEAAGVSRQQWLAAAGFDPQRLDDGTGRVELDEYERLQTLALDLSRDEALGLHLGEAASPASFDVVAYLTAHASTLRHGFETVARFHRLMFDVSPWVLEEENDTAIFWREFPRTSLRTDRMSAEFGMTGYVRMIRHFAGQKFGLRRVFFQHPSPPYRAEYTRIFAGTEHFEHRFTGIEFDRSLLDLPQHHAHPEVFSALELEAERRLDRLTRGVGYAERTREFLTSRLLTEQPDMSAVAQHLGIGVRSLRRRLREEGVSYDDLVLEVQATLAKRMLSDPKCSIHEVAYAMGFSDPAAFHRAFKRWTGLTPNEFRNAR